MAYYTTEEILGVDDDAIIHGAQMVKAIAPRSYRELAQAGGALSAAPSALPDVKPEKKSLFSRIPRWALYGAGALSVGAVGFALYRRGRR